MKKPFLSACIFYLLSAAIIFPYVRWYADNPDTFQYIAIAQKYLSGDWTHAVNGYWSPLISILLIIPILIFENDLLAFKILQILTGIFTLWQWSNLLNKIPLRNILRIILLFISIPFFLDYALLNCTPDLLFMGLLFLLLNLILSGNISEDKNLAIKTGITGGLLYLTKAFAFPFFIAFTIFIILFEIYRKTNHKPNWKNISKLYGVFFLISFFWIIILSSRYNKFTISEAAVFNSSREVAPLPGRSSELPILNKGLYAPPVNSFSAWESPGDYVNDERVTFFNSTSDYLKIIRRNLLTIYYFDFRRQIGMVFILLLIIFLFKKGFRSLINERWLLVISFFVILLYGGYSLILVHSRYTWINNMLMMLMSVYFIQTLFEKKSLRIISILTISFILFLSIKRPVKEILFTNDGDYPVSWMIYSAKHPFESLWFFYRPDVQLKLLIDELKEKKMLHGNLASLKTRGLQRDPYTNSLRISIETDCRYFGQVDDELNFLEQENELRKMDINFLITWKNTEWGKTKPIYFNSEAGVRIYEIN